MNEAAQNSSGIARFGCIAAALATLLPLYLIANGAPLGAANPEDFAQIHLQPGFAWRAGLTLLYFPAVLVAYFAFAVHAGRAQLAMLGFAFFALGNGIDGCYRAVQFMVVHYGWAAAWLQAEEPAIRAQLWQQISQFQQLVPALQLSFAVCFGCARLLIGAAAWRLGDPLVRAAAGLMILNGVLNLLPWLLRWQAPAWSIIPGWVYLWVWLLGLLGLTAALWRLQKRLPICG